VLAELARDYEELIQLLSESGAICTLSLSFNNEGPLGTFFRYIGDTGTYIARYDDLVNGKEGPIDVSKVDVSMNVSSSKIANSLLPFEKSGSRTRAWQRCFPPTKCSMGSSGSSGEAWGGPCGKSGRSHAPGASYVPVTSAWVSVRRRKVPGGGPLSPRALGCSVALSMALFVACGRSVRGDGNSASDDAGNGAEAGDPSGGGGKGGASGSSGKGGTSGLGGEAGDPACEPALPPEAPLRRLNRFEYNNTVRDVFRDESRPADALPPDFYDNEKTPVSAELVEGWHRLAHDYAVSVTEDDDAAFGFIDCNRDVESETTCRDVFVKSFGAQAFRRSLDAADIDELTTVFTTGQSLGGNFRSGVRAVVEVALQSPEFLYRPEIGEPAEDRPAGWARPTPYEMASRLSYFYWGSAPDADLLAVAERGELRSADSVSEHTQRMLTDPRVRDVVGYFYPWLLRLHGATYQASGDPAYPTFTPEIARLLPRETAELGVALTFDARGSFASLLESPFTFVNGPLAAFYGVPGVSGGDFQQVNVSPNERVGFLTHAGVLASSALGTVTNPPRRGWLIMNALLCTLVPEEPGDGPLPPWPEGLTTREFFEQSTAGAVCAGCHQMVNPLGFAFEHYDAAGLYRDTENGLPIDATGTLYESDAAGSFDGPRDVARLLAGSADARRCFVRTWFAFSQGRAATENDACFLERLDEIFVNAEMSLAQLHVQLSLSDAFLYRPEVR
jgi:hypothetical protein